ncbi:SUMF1/EgtB/PvdO family nonheme iron enzyme [Ponticaulis sp.]|uniref:SUMF1/EgtB/PvdO family nonheme iron enzyme n=1 Tax=Ponticaulis sp. TaxID=2020902 RepID=UPI000B71CDEF|nr:SUMF1/EgtB/PvdO family nonheme iron enzyme [Ponticaulis sp.]MAI90069.1 hypothetical protein [Ponticaulis sp.]OUX99725.1 MAG: hypothetical protein CBB65_06480 [Hyphomonadaceae bacterium TMED5]|tara:strand:+ start:24714 stop:27044 length:2331 start_codon:yes stop_codon:yes gene_type:complete
MARKALRPGQTIGPYTILAEQYQDDAGVTYLGKHPSAWGAPQVYIREFFPANISRRNRNEIAPARKLLAREFEDALAQQKDRVDRYLAIKEPGLIGGLGKVEENGTVYLVTDWPEGESLQTMSARDGLLSPGFVRALLYGLEGGLTALGEQGLVHGQISPETLRRLNDGDASVTHPDRLEYVATIGAPVKVAPINTPYLAPEFVSQDFGPLGPWTDMYSLAASFYQMITGLVPASAKDRIDAHAAGADDPLDMLALDTRLDDDPSLFQALASALSLKAEDRPASMPAFMGAAAIAAAIEDSPEEAAGLEPRPALGGVSGPVRIGIAAALVVLLCAVLVPFVFFSNDEDVTLAQNNPNPAHTPPPVPAPSRQSFTPVSEPTPDQLSDDLVEDDDIPEDVAAWMQVDQEDPDAVLEFLRTVTDNQTLRSQVRSRWMTLEASAWAEASADGSEDALTEFIETYATNVPPFSRFGEEARAQLADLQQTSEEEQAEAEPLEDEQPEAEEDTPVVDVEPEPVIETEAEAEGDSAPSEADSTEGAIEEELPAGPEDTGPQIGDVFTDCDSCLAVEIVSETLAVAQVETSISDFRAFLTATNRSAPTGCFTHVAGSQSIWSYGSSASFDAPGYDVSDDMPAVCVSFDEAQTFAQWMSDRTGENYRLPTAEEWLAIAGEAGSALMSCGANFADETLGAEDVQTSLFSCSDGSAFTTSPSGDGVSGMYGNVAEWVVDCDEGDCSRRLAMGGSWVSGPEQIRSSFREVFSPNSRSSTLGFRLVREVE